VFFDTLQTHSALCVVWMHHCHDMSRVDRRLRRAMSALRAAAAVKPSAAHPRPPSFSPVEQKAVALLEHITSTLLQLTASPPAPSASALASANPLSSLLTTAQSLLQSLNQMLLRAGHSVASPSVSANAPARSTPPLAHAHAPEAKRTPKMMVHAAALQLQPLVQRKVDTLSACGKQVVAYCATLVHSPLTTASSSSATSSSFPSAPSSAPPSSSSSSAAALSGLFARRRAPRIADFEIVKPISRGAFGYGLLLGLCAHTER
jgi:hypothetical protein